MLQPHFTVRELEDHYRPARDPIGRSRWHFLQTPIARTLGLNWQTVHKYLTYTTPPQRCHMVRRISALTPYQGYLLGRWASG